MKTASDIWYLTVQTFPELLHRNATQFGSRRAQWWKTEGTNTESITYSQLAVIVSELSAGLLNLGIARGDRACIMAHTSPHGCGPIIPSSVAEQLLSVSIQRSLPSR